MMNKMMKKVALVIAAATMTISATSVATFANDGQGISTMDVSTSECHGTKYVTASSANVRTAPSTDSRILFELQKGDKIEVTGITSNGWYVFTAKDPKFGGETGGYISANLVSDNQDKPQPQPSGQVYNVNVKAGYLALRSTPKWTDDDSNVIEQLHNGQQFTATQKDGKYWYGYSNSTGKYGYVNSEYLSTNKPQPSGQVYNVNVKAGYLALRSTPKWTDDDSNVIEELHNGQQFTATQKDGKYWYGYSNSTGKYGYVNSEYLA